MIIYSHFVPPVSNGLNGKFSGILCYSNASLIWRKLLLTHWRGDAGSPRVCGITNVSIFFHTWSLMDFFCRLLFLLSWQRISYCSGIGGFQIRNTNGAAPHLKKAWKPSSFLLLLISWRKSNVKKYNVQIISLHFLLMLGTTKHFSKKSKKSKYFICKIKKNLLISQLGK